MVYFCFFLSSIAWKKTYALQTGDVSFDILDSRDADITSAIISKSSPINTQSVENESGKFAEFIFISIYNIY